MAPEHALAGRNEVDAVPELHRGDGLVLGQLEDAAREEAAVEAVADQEECEGAEGEDGSVHLARFSVARDYPGPA